MRRTGKSAFDPTMGSEGMSQLLITYSIFMSRSSRKRRVFSHKAPAAGGWPGTSRLPQKKRAPEGARSKTSPFPGLSLLPSVVVGLLAVIGEIETLFLRFIAGADADGELQDQQDHERHAARPDQSDGDVPKLRDDLRPGVEIADFVGDVIIDASTAKLRIDEGARAERADDPADAVHAEGIERVVVTQHGLHLGHGEEAKDAGDGTGKKGSDGADKTGRRSDRHQARHDAGADAQQARLALDDPLGQRPRNARNSGPEQRIEERDAGSASGFERGARVEAEPAHPQHAGADRRHHHAVRWHRHLAVAVALSEHQGADQHG